MQEAQVGWDPATVSYSIPWHTRLYLMFLLVLMIAMVIRTARIAWVMRTSRSAGTIENSNAKLCAEYALGGSYPTEIVGDVAVTSETLNRFEYLSQAIATQINAMDRWIYFTLLVSLLVFTWELLVPFQAILPYGGSHKIYIANSVAETSARTALGLFVCTLTSAFTMYLKNTLNRRQLRWKHFCAQQQLRGIRSGELHG